MPTQMPTYFPLPPREHRPPVTLLRTLFVAKSWSIPDPSRAPPICFTLIADALAQAATMAPSSESPVAIIIFPGTYIEHIDLQSWVFLSSASTHQNAVTIDGTITWTPNAAGFEAVQLYFLTIARPTTVTTAGKGMSVGQNNQTTFILNGCFPDGLTVNGRSNSGDNRDFVFAATSVPGPTKTNVFTFDKCLVEWVAGRLKGMTFNDCRFRIIGSTAVPPKNPTDGTTTPVD